MKKTAIYNIANNTISLFKNKINIAIFFVALVLFFGLFSFFYGLFTIPIPGGVLGFYRMVPPTSFEIFYMIFSVIVSALIMTITIQATKIKTEGNIKGKKISAIGLATGIFGSICPACLGINFLAFGNVFTAQLAFLIPYIFWIQIGGIILLSIGLYFVAKSAYEKKCISCVIDKKVKPSPKKEEKENVANPKIAWLALIVLIIFVYQITAIFGQNTKTDSNSNSVKNMLTIGNGQKINMDNIIESVIPKAGFETNVKWNGVVTKMVKTGVLNPKKLENILMKKYKQKMKPEWRDILEGKNSNLSINNDNAVFMMYLLWTFAKSNQNQILSDSPFAKYFKNYNMGVGKAGYGNTRLLSLTPTQQKKAKYVAENASRPCCNNTTAQPDCSHGYSALGLVELMASQNFTKQEMFDTFVEFNSFWFPQTYVKNALYFKLAKGQNWDKVDKELIAGKEYSSLSGAYKVKNYLKSNFGI